MASFDEFRSAIKNGGLTRSNRFTVWFTLPSGLRTSPYFTQIGLRQIMLFCNKANLPGLSLSTAPTRTTGEVRNVPYDRNFEPITLHFYADKGMNAKYLFDEWINLVQDRRTRMFTYWDRYVIPKMSIRVEDVDDNGIYEVQLTDLYPKSISSIDLDYANSGVMSISVTFEYRNWMSSRLVDGDMMDFFNPASLSLAPNEMFVTIQGSAAPGVAQQIAKGVAAPFVPGTNSVLTGLANGVITDLSGHLTTMTNLPNVLGSSILDTSNMSLLTQTMGKVTSITGVVSGVSSALSSPAGLNIPPANLGELSGIFNTIRTVTGSTSGLASAVASLSGSADAATLATLLGNVDASLGTVMAQVQGVRDSTARHIETSVNAINQLGNLIAPNQLKGQ